MSEYGVPTSGNLGRHRCETSARTDLRVTDEIVPPDSEDPSLTPYVKGFNGWESMFWMFWIAEEARPIRRVMSDLQYPSDVSTLPRCKWVVSCSWMSATVLRTGGDLQQMRRRKGRHGVFAGDTVWSMPERFEFIRSVKALYKSSFLSFFPFNPLHYLLLLLLRVMVKVRVKVEFKVMTCTK